MATKLNIRIKANADATKPRQIAQQISAAIESGKLKPGDALPSERALSEQLGVNRKTVRAAFAQLTDDRVIETASTSNRRVSGASGGSGMPTKSAPVAARKAPAKSAATKKTGKGAASKKSGSKG